MKPVVRALCLFGLLVAGLLISAGVWFHRHYDAIMRIPFALGCWTLGALLGAYCILYLLKSLANGTDDVS